jgi:hypothetical protein
VLTISSLPSGVFTSQVQPEPKFVSAEVVNFSLKSSKLQKSLIIKSETFQFASHHALADKQFQ